MKPFAVTLAVRNNLLKERRLTLGLSLREVADHADVEYGRVCALETLRASPLRVLYVCRALDCVGTATAVTSYRCKRHKADESALEQPLKRRWSRDAEALAGFHGVTPAELWPDEILSVANPKAEIKMDREDVAVLRAALAPELPAPDDAVDDRERREIVDAALKTLSRREERVLRLRFGFDDGDESAASVADAVGVSRSRIQQIERKAMSKLRRTKMLGAL